MKTGLYAVSFNTPLGAGAGVIHLDNGTAQGGDSALWYDGNYNIDGDQFTAEIKTARHAQGMPSVFGTDTVTINLKGSWSDAGADVTGTSPQAPGLTFKANLRPLKV